VSLLVEITSQISELDDLNAQIFSAAQQKNLTTDEINLILLILAMLLKSIVNMKL
jgi:hypothetical protein